MTENLKRACVYFENVNAFDELEQMVERDAFEVWRQFSERGQDEHIEAMRQRHLGAMELIQTMRNIASAG